MAHPFAALPTDARAAGFLALGRVEKGRRNTTNLVCKLLCVTGPAKTAVARALIDHSIAQHSANRIEAKIDPASDWVAWWQGLNFEIAADAAV